MIYRQLKKTFLICSLAIAASWVYADTDHAIAEFKKSNYQTALNELKPLAEQGDAKAQLYLGGMYDRGEGVTQDFKLAAKWYLKAANQGSNEAQYSLAYLYYTGEGVPKDLSKAKEWYLKAANQGSAMAQIGLSMLLLSGDGNEADTKAAADWALKAANQGLPLAQETLGRLYMSGFGVPKDIIKANYWLTKAAKQKANSTTPSSPQTQQQTAQNQNVKPTNIEDMKFAELTKKARALWGELNGFRYNSLFHKYAYWEGTKPGGEWNIRQKALSTECETYRDSLPPESRGQYDLCMNITEMWLLGSEWANNKGNNTPETSRLVLQIEKSLNNNGKFSL